MESFLSSYGLFALFIGMLLEGELLFLSAVVLAKMGHFELGSVLATVYLGAIGHDWVFYLLGKTQASLLFDTRPSLKTKMVDFFSVVEQKPILFLTFYRFLIGFRMILLSLFGIKKITLQKFLFFSLLANFLWVGIYGFLGYYFADIVIDNVEWINRNKFYIIGGVLLIIGFFQWKGKK